VPTKQKVVATAKHANSESLIWQIGKMETWNAKRLGINARTMGASEKSYQLAEVFSFLAINLQ